jgi:hypothetical protein
MTIFTIFFLLGVQVRENEIPVVFLNWTHLENNLKSFFSDFAPGRKQLPFSLPFLTAFSKANQNTTTRNSLHKDGPIRARPGIRRGPCTSRKFKT